MWAQVKSSAQPLAGLKLMRLDQRAPIASAPARQPGERTFGVIHGDLGAAVFGRDLPLGQFQMLAAKAINRGRWQLTGPHGLCADGRTGNTASSRRSVD